MTAPAAASVAGTLTVTAFDLGFKPAAVTVPAAGRYDVTFDNTGATAHDLTFPDGTQLAADAGTDRHGRGRRPGGRPHLPVLDPGPRGRRA